MNGLFYLDEIFYSENSPYLYGIDTFSSINQSKPIQTMEHYVNIMLDSGFKARLWRQASDDGFHQRRLVRRA